MNSIKTALIKISGVTAVEIFKEQDKVCVSGIAIDKETLVSKLSSLGYPEKENTNFMSKAKSYLSGGVGKYDKIK